MNKAIFALVPIFAILLVASLNVSYAENNTNSTTNFNFTNGSEFDQLFIDATNLNGLNSTEIHNLFLKQVQKETDALNELTNLFYQFNIFEQKLLTEQAETTIILAALEQSEKNNDEIRAAIVAAEVEKQEEFERNQQEKIFLRFSIHSIIVDMKEVPALHVYWFLGEDTTNLHKNAVYYDIKYKIAGEPEWAFEKVWHGFEYKSLGKYLGPLVENTEYEVSVTAVNGYGYSATTVQNFTTDFARGYNYPINGKLSNTDGIGFDKVNISDYRGMYGDLKYPTNSLRKQSSPSYSIDGVEEDHFIIGSVQNYGVYGIYFLKSENKLGELQITPLEGRVSYGSSDLNDLFTNYENIHLSDKEHPYGIYLESFGIRLNILSPYQIDRINFLSIDAVVIENVVFLEGVPMSADLGGRYVNGGIPLDGNLRKLHEENMWLVSAQDGLDLWKGVVFEMGTNDKNQFIVKPIEGRYSEVPGDWNLEYGYNEYWLGSEPWSIGGFVVTSLDGMRYLKFY